MKFFLFVCAWGFIKCAGAQIQSGQLNWIKSVSNAEGAVYDNASFLPNDTKFLFGSAAGNTYGVSGLFQGLLFCQFPVYQNAGGIYYYTHRLPGYTQSQIAMSYGIKISPITAFGLRFKHTQGQTWSGDKTLPETYTADLSYHVKYGPKTTLATHLENIGSDLFQKRPSCAIWNIGLKHEVSKQVSVTTELSKPISMTPIFRYHISYLAGKRLLLEAGGSINPARYFFGLSYRTERFKIGLHVYTHSILGNSYSTGVFYALPR